MAKDNGHGRGRSAGSRIAVIEKAVKALGALLPAEAGLTPTEVAEAIAPTEAPPSGSSPR